MSVRHSYSSTQGFIKDHHFASFRFTGAALLLNLYGIQARGVTKPNIILGVAFGLGGLGQIIAGILAWACGNTFGVCLITLARKLWAGKESQELTMIMLCFLTRQSVTFSSYGAFWLSFSSMSHRSCSSSKPANLSSSSVYPAIWCGRGLR